MVCVSMPWHPLTAAQVTIAFMPREYPQPFTQPIAPQAQALGLGLGLYDYPRLDRAMASRRSAYDYMLPWFLGDALTLGTWLVASDGKLTIERRFQLIRGRDQATMLRGRWELVCIELGSGKSQRMPQAFCRVYLPALPAPLANALPEPS